MAERKIVQQLHAPDIEPRLRHPKIFEVFDGLQTGESLQLTNDHDPRPLQYQFMIEREGLFEWDYLEEGPKQWCVVIEKK
ncbi:DUF2249 domain-containing protein [Evansella sp. AB-P1]|uniref:DUF2249 domain-containing protein n=1 Tax=Evansella sp. AB-P1 TaxID=3037653 RepID=UPI00241DFEE5|nr:DUF2249 domain-containing protein [Evansella sp. AB-P1]MDG5789543.1 DUF2249 domain-containing protein [Evansella sp. AB-P1]